MFEQLANAAALAMTMTNLVAMFLGMAGGVIIGAIPGLTGTMAVTLVLPFTFYMPPITAILLLVAIYKGAMYGGSISAILINTPGTGAAACTVMDGYPLAKQGKAGAALYMALYASCVADFISNLSLLFFAGAIASFALSFGPPEFFALIVFSLTIVASLSNESVIKGLISACLGLLLATVGMDLVYGTGRYTFGSVDLMGGFSFIPIIIGLFAVPEVIRACLGKPHPVEQVIDPHGGKLSFSDFKRCFLTIIRGSVIGVILGAIPGIGGAPAAYMSYSEAKRTSKNSKNFGKGELEGVAAAESGNNGCAGATLIPLLSLGIPGDVVTAVMLGAFMMHGLTPGPLLFTQHLTLVYAIYIGIMVSSLFMLISGFGAIRAFSKIVHVPKPILFPAILVVCAFGAYSINNSLFDVLSMGIIGVIGYILSCYKFSEAPLLVAFILGPMFEDNLRRSLLLSHGNWSIFIRSPICWIFLALALLSVLFVAWKEMRRFKTLNEANAAARLNADN